MTSNRRVTTETLRTYRAVGQKVVFVTAYDYATATFAERAGVDMILVGDSAAMTMLGHSTTVPIGMDEMLVFTKAVTRACRRTFVVGDMPFLSYQAGNEDAVRNAGAFVRSGCDAVKCEGGKDVPDRIRAIAGAGIAVMGHIGLTPQSLGQLGGFRVQGRSLEQARELVGEALAIQDAGAFALLIEAVPAATAALVRSKLNIPVYGIGAGPEVDGQLVICHDILGSFVGDIEPSFVKRYASVGSITEDAFAEYAREVRNGTFPQPEHCYSIAQSEDLLIRSELPVATGDVDREGALG